MGERTSIKDVFIQCQSGMQSHGKLISTLSKIYDKTEFEKFWSEFRHYLKYAMIIFKREPAVERLIDFVAKFIPALNKKMATEDEEDGNESDHDDVSDNRLLQEMFDFLLQSHSAKDRGVRFRCCQLINKLLTNLGEEAQIDDELYDRLYECMLERLKDKWPVVRYHAVMAMSRLQDPGDENCPVIKAYLFLLNCDPNPDVRRAVLSSIAPSTKTLSSIIGRTRDVKDTVRKTAYEVLSEKIHIKALSIARRLQILNEGLNDRSDAVKNACSGKLLQAWLRTFGGNILDFLKSLDVEDSTDVCSLVLETIFKANSPQDLVERFDILGESLLVPQDQLTCESALYWQAVCKYMHGMGNEADEFMEKVLPACVDYCTYVKSYIDDLKNVDDPEIQLTREFIIEQLLMIASYMDTADQASRKALENLLHNMLMMDHVSHRLVKAIVIRICELKGTSEALVPYLAETVSEIREPISVVAKDIAAEERRQVNLKIASIHVHLNQLCEDLAEAVKAQDFTQASSIKEQIASIRVQLNQLREDLDEAVKAQDFTQASSIKEQVAELDAEKVRLLEATETATEEVRTERNDPQTILKCQTIISEMLQLLKLSSISPTLQMMIESQILPGIQNEDAEVRNMAMKALGLCCYLSKDLLVSYIPLFMQASQIDVEGVRVTALQVLFDLLHIYGLEIVDANDGSSDETASSVDGEESGSNSESKNSDKNGAASKLVAIICSFLDGENSELRTCAAEGLAKLLLSGRVVSSKILSHLILLWYNPLSEDDTHLRDCLGTFFPLYALAGRSNQEVVEEAFLPTLKTLLNAPATSPLAEVDVNNVAELLVQLTNTKLITQNQKPEETSQDNPGHDNLSEKVCNEVLSNPDSSTNKLWIKILNQMEVSPDNEVVLKDLRILCYKMVKLVKDKACLKSLQKFQTNISEMASKFVTNDDDLENIEIEPVAVMEAEAEETEEEQTEDTVPRKKRVRRLHTQNLTLDMTLGLDSESDMDTSQTETIDVDASCLERRTSTVSETPTRRSRKNTASSVVTEIAGEDDVFCIPEAPVARKRISVDPKLAESDKDEEEESEEEVKKTQDKDVEAVSGAQEAVVVLQDVFKPSGKVVESEVAKTPTEKLPAEVDQADKLTEDTRETASKEKVSPAKEKSRKTPTKDKQTSKDKEIAPQNEDGATEKNEETETAASPRRSHEKRKSRGDGDTEIPAKSPKRLEDKSPGREKAVDGRSPRRSSEKRKSKGEGSEVPSKSPRRSSDRSPSGGDKSPSKQKDKVADTKSTRKATDKSPEKSSSRLKDKAAEKHSARSADKSDATAKKSPIKSRSRDTSAKSSERNLEKRKAKMDSVTETHAKSPRIVGDKSPRKQAEKPPVKLLNKSPRRVTDIASSKQKEDDLKKKTEKKGLRTAAAKVPEPKSPRNVRNAGSRTTEARSPRNVGDTKEKSSSDTNTVQSPKATRKSVSQTIESQEPKSPRATRRASSQVVYDTPEPKSPASLRSRPQRSIAETPEVKSPKPARKPAEKQASGTGESKTKTVPKVQKKDVSKPDDKDESPSKTKTRGVTRTASGSAVTGKTSRLGKGKTGTSSDESSAISSPEAPLAKKKKTAGAESVTEESEEEDQLKRKAKPSRKSVTAVGDRPGFKSPSAQSVRSTPARREVKSSQEDDQTKETNVRRGRSSLASTPSTVSSRTPGSTASSAAVSSQSATKMTTRRSAVGKGTDTQRSKSDSVLSSPELAAATPRTRASQQAAGDATKRATRSKVQEAPSQTTEKKLRDAGKRLTTKTLPSRAKTTRK